MNGKSKGKGKENFKGKGEGGGGEERKHQLVRRFQAPCGRCSMKRQRRWKLYNGDNSSLKLRPAKLLFFINATAHKLEF